MSFATDQVTRIEKLLASNVGVQSINVGNQQVAYADLLKQYDYWRSRAARENGTRPRVSTIELGGFSS